MVVLLIGLWSFEALMLYLADLPTMLFLALAEMTFPRSVFMSVEGGDPFYVPMNLIGCVLWGGIFTLIPFTRNLTFRLRRRHQTANSNP